MEDNCKTTETRIGAISTRLTNLKEERQKLINGIYECVDRLQPIQESPKETEVIAKLDGCLLSEIEDHLNVLRGDNDKLELIRIALQKII